MKNALWPLFLVLAAAGLASLASSLRGPIEIVWNAEPRQIAPAAAVFGVAGLVSLGLLAGFVLTWARQAPARARARADKRLIAGLAAVSAGDTAEAGKRLAQARAQGTPLLAGLLAAQTALAEGRPGDAAGAYTALTNDPDTKLIGLRGLLTLALRSGDIEGGRSLVARVRKLAPKAPWASEAAFDLAIKASDWQGALEGVTHASKARLLAPETGARRRAVLLAAQALGAEANGQHGEALKHATAALKLEPGLVPAAALAARETARTGHAKRAQEIVTRAWTVSPHPDLAMSLAGFMGSQAEAALRALTQLQMVHPETRLLTAALALRAGQPEEALAAVAPLKAGLPTARTARVLSEIAAAKGDAAGARAWADRAADARRDAVWRCEACAHEARDWAPVCPACGAFDRLAWVSAGPGALDAGSKPADGRALYRLPGPPPAKPVPERPAGPAPSGPRLVSLRPPDDPGPVASEDELFRKSAPPAPL
jgi:HemY protein